MELIIKEFSLRREKVNYLYLIYFIFQLYTIRNSGRNTSTGRKVREIAKMSLGFARWIILCTSKTKIPAKSFLSSCNILFIYLEKLLNSGHTRNYIHYWKLTLQRYFQNSLNKNASCMNVLTIWKQKGLLKL